ncbi:MAG TPA: hypothetical protein PLZ93_13200 [Nocardioides sp.]|nr:hypothetical protein [Nocardioides sp.]
MLKQAFRDVSKSLPNPPQPLSKAVDGGAKSVEFFRVGVKQDFADVIAKLAPKGVIGR